MNKETIKWEDITLSDNYLFQTYMKDENNCKELLSEILGKPVREIVYKETEKELKNSILAKGIRVDVYLEGDDKIYDVEMQTSEDDLPKRSRYYHSAIDIDSLQPGQYYNDLKETYVIFICIFDPLEKGAYIYNIQNQCTNIQDCDYNDESHTIFLNTKGKKGNISDDLKVFLKAVDGMFDSSVKSATIKKRIADIVDNEKWRKSYMFQDMRDIGNIRKGKEEFALTLVRKGKITIEEASEELGTPVENLKAKLEESK